VSKVGYREEFVS